jgi:hypothetical protein
MELQRVFKLLSIAGPPRDSGTFNEDENPWGVKELTPGQEPTLEYGGRTRKKSKG